MESDGWVTATVVAQRGRPDEKVYTVSGTGRAELARWIAEPPSGRGGALSDSRARDVAVKRRGGDGEADRGHSGLDPHIVGGAGFAVELDAERAIKQGTELAARL
jgi:DNA-binding PadR family transcriptional regulator